MGIRMHWVLRMGMGLAALSVCGAISAQQIAIGELEAVPTGGLLAVTSQKVTFSAERPKSVGKEPVYRYKPQYGLIPLGDAKENGVIVVMDGELGATRTRLYVDGNANGDLTDDPPVNLMPLAEESRAGEEKNGKKGERLGADVQVTARYSIAGRGGLVPSTLKLVLWDGELTYNRAYSRQGKLTIGGKTYRIALIDQQINGRFNDYKHGSEDLPRVTLLVDKDSDGKFDPKKESYDVSKPVRLAGMRFEVAMIDAKGTRLTLRSASGDIEGAVKAADLKVGSKVIGFDSETTDGKSVSFPDDFKGKVVLLDFWAVWCPPCREEVPNIVKTYNQFHKRGFEILGISLDKANFDKQLAAYTQENGMTWAQVYDGGYWNAEVAKLYGVDSIPHALLVDGDTGKILAMGDALRGEGLPRAIAQALQARRGRPGGE